MKKSLYILAFLIFPLFTMGQEKAEISKLDIHSALESGITIKKIDPISVNPLKQTKVLNQIKSNELISVRAYIKANRLKRKETILS